MRDSAGRRLGVKSLEVREFIPGNIIMRQRGTKVKPGTGVGIGKDPHHLCSKSRAFVEKF